MEHVPLAVLGRGQASFRIYDSLLSEYAALGFDYGYSVAHKDALVCSEAQFGDFENGAQIVIDQFIVAAEDKWHQTSGLVLLLPHGYEGQGPEHSSARIERFLTLAAEDNIQIVYPSTAAQYFHVLRRQMRRDIRKPLVVFTPKSLLRARPARSAVDDLAEGSSFREVIDDAAVQDPSAVRRVVICTGKVAYDALAKRESADGRVAIVRVEQLYPWPEDQLAAAVARYEQASEIVWLQEEPENMGAWPYAGGRLQRLVGPDYELRVVARAESASPAAGSLTVHLQEQEELLDQVFSGLQ